MPPLIWSRFFAGTRDRPARAGSELTYRIAAPTGYDAVMDAVRHTWLGTTGIGGHDDERLLSREEIDELNVMLARRRTSPPPRPLHRSAA